MGWQIDLFQVPPGADQRVVRDVQYDWAEHDEYSIPPASDETDRWIEHVVGLLETVAPGLKILDDDDGTPMLSRDRRGHLTYVRVWQPDGPLLSNVYPECLDVRIKRGYAESYDGENFDALWDACKVLAEHAECAVFPEYDDDSTDMTMDRDEARRELHWA